jgi:hypothetical protein
MAGRGAALLCPFAFTLRPSCTTNPGAALSQLNLPEPQPLSKFLNPFPKYLDKPGINSIFSPQFR